MTFQSFRLQSPAPPRYRFITLPLSVSDFPLSQVWASPLGSRLAVDAGRIEFVILRTDCSPPAAPHLVSPRRSCIRFQAGERLLGEDSHLSDRVRFQAHFPA